MFWKSVTAGAALVETGVPSNWVVWILCSGHLGMPGGLSE